MRPKLELKVETAFVSLAAKHNMLAVKLAPRGIKGLPDRLVLGDGGQVAFIEFKRADGKGKVAKFQQAMHKLLEGMGFHASVQTDEMEALLWCQERFGIPIPGKKKPSSE